MKSHILHFGVLAILLGSGAYAFFGLSGNQPAQFLIAVCTAIAYVLWGIIHHVIQRDLHPKIVVEYSLIGIVAILLLLIVMGS